MRISRFVSYILKKIIIDINEFILSLQKREMELQKQQREADALKGCTKEDILEHKKQSEQAYNDQLHRITEMVRFNSILVTLWSEKVCENHSHYKSVL